MKIFETKIEECGGGCPAYSYNNGAGFNEPYHQCLHLGAKIPKEYRERGGYGRREILLFLKEEYTKTEKFPDWCPLKEFERN